MAQTQPTAFMKSVDSALISARTPRATRDSAGEASPERRPSAGAELPADGGGGGGGGEGSMSPRAALSRRLGIKLFPSVEHRCPPAPARRAPPRRALSAARAPQRLLDH
jgi:hypothetical protein